MVKVVRARDANELAMARQVSSEKVAEDLERARQRELRLAQIRSTTFSVPGQVLLDLRAAIASPNSVDMRHKILDQEIELERQRALYSLRKIIEDSIPKEIPNPSPPVEKSSEETKESETKHDHV